MTAMKLAFLEHPDALLDPIKASMECGWAENTAKAKAYALRKELMTQLMEKHRGRLEGLGITDERLENELAAIAFHNVADYYETLEGTDGRSVNVLRDIKKLPLPLQRAIKSVEYDTTINQAGDIIVYVSKLVFYDKLASLKTLLEMRGAFMESVIREKLAARGVIVEENPLDKLSIPELEELARMQQRASTMIRAKVTEARTIEHEPQPARKKRKSEDPEDY